MLASHFGLLIGFLNVRFQPFMFNSERHLAQIHSSATSRKGRLVRFGEPVILLASFRKTVSSRYTTMCAPPCLKPHCFLSVSCETTPN